jgi:glycine/D-amino acid oxidase-like deaminating enzyme
MHEQHETPGNARGADAGEGQDVIVVGGGQAGLAIGYFLAQLRILMGDRPVRYFSQVSGQDMAARLGRARRALSGPRQENHVRRQAVR